MVKVKKYLLLMILASSPFLVTPIALGNTSTGIDVLKIIGLPTAGFIPKSSSLTPASLPVSGSKLNSSVIGDKLKTTLTLPAELPDPTMNLGFGMSGKNVLNLQKFLQSTGYYSGPLTGRFYSLTKKAVKDFQTANNIPATGFVGPLTHKKIKELATSIVPSTGSTATSTQQSTNPVVQIITPKGGEVCYRNSVCPINYNLSIAGPIGDRWLSVELYKGTTFKAYLSLEKLSSSTEKKLRWNIHNAQETGDDFKIKISVFKDKGAVSSRSPEVFDMSTEVFSIK